MSPWNAHNIPWGTQQIQKWIMDLKEKQNGRMNEIGGEEWVRNATHWWEESKRASISGHSQQRRRAWRHRRGDRAAATRMWRRQMLHARNGRRGGDRASPYTRRRRTLLANGCRSYFGRWVVRGHRGHRKCEGNGQSEGKGKVGVSRKVKMWEGEGKNERNGYNNYTLRAFFC